MTFDVVAFDKASQALMKIAEQFAALSKEMGKVDGRRVNADVDVDTSKASHKMTAWAAGLGASIGSAVAGVAAAGFSKVTGFIGDSVQAFSDLSESANAVQKIYGDWSEDIVHWGEKNANAFGLSRRAFQELVTPLGAGLKNLGLPMEDVTKNTIGLTERAADMASVFNTSVPDALEAIQAGLRGEADPLERYGVGLSDAAVTARALADTGKKSADSLTAQEKATARLNLIMDQTKDVAGDFAQTSGGLANSQRIAAAKTEELQAKIGEKLVPVMQWWMQVKLKLVEVIGEKLLPALQGFAGFVQHAASVVGDWLGKMDMGPVVANVTQAAGGLRNLWNQIVGDVRAWAASHQDQIRGMVDGARGLFQQFGDLAKAVIAAVSAFWEKHGERILTIVTGVLTGVVGIIRGVLQMIQGIFQVFSAILSGDWSKAWAGLRNIAEGQLRIIMGVVDGILGTIVNLFGGSWEKIKQSAAVKWNDIVITIKSSINKILEAWNWVASKIGLPQVGLIQITPASTGGALRAFASGGPVPGVGSRDTVPAMLMPGEFVLSKRAVANLGGLGAVDTMHRGVAHYAEGGPVGSVVGWAKNLFTGRLGALPGGMAGEIVGKLVDATVGKLVERVRALFSGVGAAGAGVQRWAPLVLQALAMMGQPAILLQTVLRRMNQESGGNPRAINLTDINAQRGDPSRGLMQTIGATFRAYHFAGTSWDIYDPLANILASMRYALARYGSLSAAYNRPGGYDSGGWLMPGYTMAYNGTGRPEQVLPPGGGGRVVVESRVVLDPAGGWDKFVALLREWVRVEGGGNVQRAIGG
ncbi:MAG TPA: transglycosylase SLT domain-containing protein [Pseudonocardiaceae bacterium]